MGEEGGGGSDDFDPHGDPNTDPKERRRIRYEYRQLIAETQSKDQKKCTLTSCCCAFSFPFSILSATIQKPNEPRDNQSALPEVSSCRST